MADNISVKVTADVIDLTTKFAVAKASSSGLSSELNKLGKEAASTGLSDTLKAQLTQVAEQSVAAKARVADLSAQIKELTPAASSAGAALSALTSVAGQFGVALSVGGMLGFGEQALTFAADAQHMA